MGRTTLFRSLSIASLSVLVISYQIALLNALAYINFTRFASLVISLALLGFGASGTFLAIFPLSKQRGKFPPELIIFTLLIPALLFCYRAALLIPLDVQYMMIRPARLLILLLYCLILFIPFFLTALLIGLALSRKAEEVPLIYGANLGGSGAGGIAVILLLLAVPSYYLPFRLAGIALLALIFWWLSTEGRFPGTRALPLQPMLPFFTAALLLTFLGLLWRPPVRPDQYKTVAYIRTLGEQGQAEKLFQESGPRGVLEMYASPLFHNALFAHPAVPVSPPDQALLLLNGEQYGTVYSIDSLDDAAVLDYTPQSVVYRLMDRPRVLIIDETGGTGIALALRMNAESVTVVQENPVLVRMWAEELPDFGFPYFSHPRVEVIKGNPRLFLKAGEERWDIIHLAGSEGMPAAASGLRAAEEDYLLTTGFFRDCLRRLTPGGAITVTRGLQTPPRDNLKIIFMAERALEEEGTGPPETRLLQGRNYLAVNTILFRTPVQPELVDRYTELLSELNMDPEWYPGIRSGSLEMNNRIPGPEGETYSWLHHGAKAVFEGGGEELLASWTYDVRPATDNRPYFHSFFRWKFLRRIVRETGTQWVRSTETGYLLLVATFGGVAVFGFILILLPLIVRRTSYLRKGFLRRFALFPLIGTAFMFVEMGMIHKLGVFLGDQTFSVAAVITAMLIFSGIGSVLQGKISGQPGIRIRYATLGVLALLGGYFWAFSPLVALLAGAALPLRFGAAVVFAALPSFFMGWFFASGIESVHNRFPGAVPLAWGLNGFASVAAAPLASILSISWGFNTVFALAMGCYLLTGLSTLTWANNP